MAHFVKIVNGLVVKGIVAEPEFFNTFVDDSPGIWLQTSYNTRGGIHYEPDSDVPSEDQSLALRKNFAGIGFSYDEKLDAFIPPKPYPSWVLDLASCQWNPPVAVPEEDPGLGMNWWWDEEAQQWIAKSET